MLEALEMPIRHRFGPSSVPPAGPLVAAALLATSVGVSACLWDDDALRAEAEGLPGTAEIVAGFFERNPPRYYEMRLERAAAILAADPDALEQYDNAGVAADRLGRGDAAIAWMAAKREALERAGTGDPRIDDHRYRYHANLGTFLAHRWLRAGRGTDADLRRARDEIARAIAINADAHFGRERYQLLVLDWLIERGRGALRTTDSSPLDAIEGVGGAFPYRWNAKALERLGYDDAVAGLSGLIALGDAWGSVPVFLALGGALDDGGNAALAYIVRLRLRELLAGDAERTGDSAGSVDAPKSASSGEDLVPRLGSSARQRRELDAWYREARIAAGRWQRERASYLEAGFASGRHPDTDPDFWRGFEPPDVPSYPWQLFDGTTATFMVVVIALLLLYLAVRIVGVAVRALSRRSRAARST